MPKVSAVVGHQISAQVNVFEHALHLRRESCSFDEYNQCTYTDMRDMTSEKVRESVSVSRFFRILRDNEKSRDKHGGSMCNYKLTCLKGKGAHVYSW